jgi:hypothetical protein
MDDGFQRHLGQLGLTSIDGNRGVLGQRQGLVAGLLAERDDARSRV